MLAKDNGASLSTIGSASSERNGAAAFTTTHWSLVLTAQGESPAACDALEKLCRTYWRPIFAFLRRQGVSPEEAEDITQGFFAVLLERRDFDTLRAEKGRLRSKELLGVYFLDSNIGWVAGCDASNYGTILKLQMAEQLGLSKQVEQVMCFTQSPF